MDFSQLEQIATNLTFYLNIVVLAAVLFGALVGFIRGFWTASFRFVLYAILIGGGFIAMPYIIDILLDVNVSAWVPVISGIQITTLRELPGQLITMVPVEGLVITPELIEVVIELTSAILALVLFIVYLIVMSILIFPLHWILFPLTVGLFFRRKFRKKHKMRLLGAGFGAMQAALSVTLSMLPLAALDVTIRQMDNLDEDVPFGTALSAIGSAYGDTVLATILKAIQTTSMPNGLDVAAVDHLLGMTLGDAQTSLRQEFETILLLANELLETGFISGDTQLATFILNSSSDQLLLAIAGGQALATPTIDVNLLLANMTPEIAQSIFTILSQSELVTTLIPSAIETAASLDMVEAYVTPDIINSLMDTVDWSQELVTLGAVAAAAVDLDLHLMGTGGAPVDPLTFDSSKVETLALALADSQLISGALPIAMDTLATQYVPEPYYTDLAIADLDFTQYDWQAELTNIAGLVSETLHVYQTIDPENFNIFSVNPTDVDSLLNGIGSSTFIMDLFPTMVELGLDMALTQANITDMTIDLSAIVWADELAMISDVYTELYAVGEDPLTYNWSTAEEEKITAMNAGIAALFSSNLMPTILPAVLEYGVTMIPTEYAGWVDLSLIDLDGLTGEQWSSEFQSIFELYREIINPDGTFPTDPQALLNDSAKVDLIASYLGNSTIVTPLLSNALEQAVSSFDFATVLGFPFDATSLNFDDVDWSLEFPLIADIASHATSMDLSNITSTDIDILLNLILDSQVFYPALPEIVSGLASSFDLAAALPGVDLSLETLEGISAVNGWQAEVDLLVHVFEIIEQNFGGINGIATFDFASYLSNASAPAVIQDMANTMLDSQLFYGAFTSLIIDALETASIPVSADTSTWTSVEWKAEVAVITDLLGVFSTYSLDIANLANIIDNPDIEGIIRDGLVPAFDSVILYDMLTDIMTDAITTAGYALPADIATWTSVEWKAEMSIVADVMEGLQDQGITLADLGGIVDNPNVGNVIRVVLVDALDSRLFGPIIKDTIESAIVSANLSVPVDIDTWDNTVWATELGYIADVFDGINDYGLTLQTLSNLTTVTDAGGLIDNILVPAIDSQLIGDNIISTLKSSLTSSGLSVPVAMDSWTDAQWKVELSAIGAVLTAAQQNTLDINSFTTIMDRTDIGTIMREVVVLMFDSEILGTNVKDTIQDSFAASPEVAIPGDINLWTTNEWKAEVLNLANVMDQLTAYDVNPADVGTIMDLPNAADAVEDILLAMMDSRMLKTSVQNVLTQTISSTGFATPDTSAWTDLQWETEIGEIADILATSDTEGLGLETLSSVVLSQATAASLGRLMNEVADSALLITGLNATLNDLFNTPDIGQKLSSPIAVDAATVDWEIELAHLAFITDNIANLASTTNPTWADDTANTLIRLRRSQILGSHTETLLLDGFTSLGVNDYINASATDGIVYWIDVEIIREDAILPDPENPLLSLNNALGILDDTKDSISGAIPSGSGQAEALLSDINDLHKDYGWIQDGKLTEIVDRGLDQAGIDSYLGLDAALLRPEVVETDPDELPLLGRLMDTIGSTDLNLLTFQSSSTGLIDNILKNIELLEMFKAENPGDPAANVALITRMFSSSPNVQEIVREQGIIDLAHRENVATEGDPDETVLLTALNSMVGIKDILSNTTSLTNSQVLKDIRDLETVYEVIEGDDPLTVQPDGTLAEKTRDIIEGSAYFATYSPDMDYSQIYLDAEIDLLINDILGVKDTLTIDDDTINSQKAVLVSLFTDISSSMFLGNAREDILNDMIDDATARSGSDLLNAELPTFDWQGEMDAIDEGLDALPTGSLTTLDALTIDTLFNAANGTRIMARIFVEELNDLSTELNTAPTPGFVWTTAKLTPIYSRTLAELIDVESLSPISEANYSSVGNKIAEFDRLIVLGDGLVDETVGNPFYDRALAANYLPAFITKVTTNTYSSVSKFDVTTDFSEVGAQFDEVTLAAKAVNSTYGDPINHAAALVALESALDAAIAAGVEPEVAEMSLRIQGVVHVNTADYTSITTDYPAFAEMFLLDISLD